MPVILVPTREFIERPCEKALSISEERGFEVRRVFGQSVIGWSRNRMGLPKPCQTDSTNWCGLVPTWPSSRTTCSDCGIIICLLLEVFIRRKEEGICLETVVRKTWNFAGQRRRHYPGSIHWNRLSLYSTNCLWRNRGAFQVDSLFKQHCALFWSYQC